MDLLRTKRCAAAAVCGHNRRIPGQGDRRMIRQPKTTSCGSYRIKSIVFLVRPFSMGANPHLAGLQRWWWMDVHIHNIHIVLLK